MPVLDAKALTVDPEGMAFLLRVLCPAPLASKLQAKEVPPSQSLSWNVRMHFRINRRTKQLLSNPA